MIVSNIIGGLGNQMFQYAAGRSLASNFQQTFKLDISGFKHYSLHQGYELGRVFGCNIEYASSSCVHGLLGWQSYPLVRNALKFDSMSSLRAKTLIFEPYFNYWDGINTPRADSYLIGYWQSEKYFKNTSALIKSDFSFASELTGLNKDIANHMRIINSVSMHVRRGDYVSNSKAHDNHGVCSLKYYQYAIDYIAKYIKEPFFYIFSDDISWVKSNIKINYPCIYVDHNTGVDSYKDMHLMTLCKHHIVANSTFSWWGAWLGVNKEKIVIAPKNWFANQLNTNDLIPESWILL